MNEHASNPMHADEPSLPEELRATSQALDRLAISDRAAAGASFEQRLAALTCPGLPIDTGSVDTLADADRHAASATLEDRIFVATRSLLNHPAERIPAWVTHAATFRLRARSVRWALRVAAMLALVAGAAVVYQAGNPAVPELNPDTPAVRGSDFALENGFENLANILSVSLGGTENDSASAGTENTLIETGDLEFPRLDFLSTEMEGSL